MTLTPAYRATRNALLLAYLVLAVIYSVVTPIFEVSDELWHYPMVQYVATNGFSLPSPSPDAPWRQEGGQPPLYYLAAALLTAPIDTSDLPFIRRVNPHADIGTIMADGNANMITHRVEAEAFPWQGAVLAVHIARFFSIALSFATLLVTEQLARAIFPNWPLVALGALALNAFLPMFLFISASVNNDNLSNLLGNLLTLLIVRLLKTPTAPSLRFYVLLGVVTGAGLLAKLNIGFLIPLVALALLLVSVRLRSIRPLLVGGLISGVLTVVIAGWWYLRNAQLYGDPTGLSAFLDTVGRRFPPANMTQLWAERHSFTQAYWGFFGGVNVPMPDTLYLILNIFGGLTLASAGIYLLVLVLRKRTDRRLNEWLALGVTIAWPLITFVSYLRWTAETQASQGRLVFGALSSLSLWMAVGLLWPLAARFQRVALGLMIAGFGSLALLVPFAVIAPAYAQPVPIVTSITEPLAVFIEPDGTHEIKLLDAEVVTETIHPEETVIVNTIWQLDQPLTRDWSLFVHLNTADGVIISQRDVYPGGGRLATSDPRPDGLTWENPIAIRVPITPYAPNTLSVTLGWYDLSTGERLQLADGSETVTIGTLSLEPREDASGESVPNPMHINFARQIELVGYELSTLSPAAGEEVELTLYWRGLQPVSTNYTVFVHIIDPRTSNTVAGSDAWPAAGNAPTSSWVPGELVEDRHTLTVNADAPPDIYEIEVGLYVLLPDGSYTRPRIVTADGGMANDYLYLTRVRVMPAEEAAP